LNYLEINGEWYHADITWDDPLYVCGKPVGGDASRKYFLLSDKAFNSGQRSPHYGWRLHGECREALDTRFDENDWENHETPWFRENKGNT